MYGTVGRMRVKDGKYDELLAVMKSYQDEPEGGIASYTFRLDKDPNQLILVAVFRDKESYFANADDPKTDAWFKGVRACLESDPEWNDGEVVVGD